MKKLKIMLLVTCLLGSLMAFASPKDSVIVKIDARNQEIIGSGKRGHP